MKNPKGGRAHPVDSSSGHMYGAGGAKSSAKGKAMPTSTKQPTGSKRGR